MRKFFLGTFYTILAAVILLLGLNHILKKNLSPVVINQPIIPTSSPVKNQMVETMPTEIGADEKNTINIFQKLAPAVVFIKNAALRRDFYSLNIYEIPQGAGSGFMWDSKGHIVTNFHVIYQADKVDVILSDQSSHEAKIVGVAPEYDLAVLKINAPLNTLTPIPLGSSKNLLVGQKTLAIGNPFGLDHSLSSGIVSALGRSIQSIAGRKIYNAIQTDAAINPGNSGGPLLDSAGNLIGVNTAIFSPSGASSGIGFAIPSDTVARVVPELISKGKFTRVGLGVILVPDPTREKMKLTGAVILQVSEESAAEKAGLRGAEQTDLGQIILGDSIIAIDDHPIKNNDDLYSYFEKDKQDGDSVKITYMRDGKQYETTATLQNL